MDERNNDLWQGGPWERSDPRGRMPGAMPPRYVPPRPVLRPRRRKRRFSLPVCMGLAALLVSLVAIGAVMDSLWPVQLLPGGGEDYAYRQPGHDEEKLDTTPPAVPRAETGTGVTVELCQDSGESLTYTQIYDKNLPSMVSIQAEDAKSYSTGTGVVLTADGYLITNAHVVAGADKVQVACADNRVLDAALVGFDAREDLAVLKVEADDLTPAEFGDSSALRCGDPVAAIGDPLGYRSTITDGIVSALDRLITTSSSDANGRAVSTTLNVLQTNCAINPGNSGGPLFDSYGNVVGIVSAKYTQSGSGVSAEGLGFALPINDVKDILSDLMEHGYVTGKPYMGVQVTNVSDEAQRYGVVAGAAVQYVAEGSCAEKAGLKVGDIITAIDDTAIDSSSALTAALSSNYKAGDKATLTIVREQKEQKLTVTFDEKNSETEANNQLQQNQQSQQSQQYQQGQGGYYQWPFGGFNW